MSDAIRVESVGKRYVIGGSGTASYGALRDVLADGMRSFARRAARPVRRGPVERAMRRETLWALEDVSFSVGRGERLYGPGKRVVEAELRHARKLGSQTARRHCTARSRMVSAGTAGMSAQVTDHLPQLSPEPRDRSPAIRAL